MVLGWLISQDTCRMESRGIDRKTKSTLCVNGSTIFMNRLYDGHVAQLGKILEDNSLQILPHHLFRAHLGIHPKVCRIFGAVNCMRYSCPQHIHNIKMLFHIPVPLIVLLTLSIASQHFQRQAQIRHLRHPGNTDLPD